MWWEVCPGPKLKWKIKRKITQTFPIFVFFLLICGEMFVLVQNSNGKLTEKWPKHFQSLYFSCWCVVRCLSWPKTQIGKLKDIWPKYFLYLNFSCWYVVTGEMFVLGQNSNGKLKEKLFKARIFRSKFYSPLGFKAKVCFHEIVWNCICYLGKWSCLFGNMKWKEILWTVHLNKMKW